MAIGNIDSACSAYLLSEKQLKRHYQSVKIGFPALPWTPEPRIHNHIYISPSHKRFLRHLHPQNKQKTLSKQTLDLLRPPMVEGHRKRPGGFKISDPRFTSPQATWKAKTGDKRGNNAEQMVTLVLTDRYLACLSAMPGEAILPPRWCSAGVVQDVLQGFCPRANSAVQLYCSLRYSDLAWCIAS
jgi:hypothetical protein